MHDGKEAYFMLQVNSNYAYTQGYRFWDFSVNEGMCLIICLFLCIFFNEFGEGGYFEDGVVAVVGFLLFY